MMTYLVRMPKKAPEDKMTGQLLVMLPESLLEDLRLAARASTASPAELLRRAAKAIVRCHQSHGEVPMDMELIQRQVGLSAEAARRDELRRGGLAAAITPHLAPEGELPSPKSPAAQSPRARSARATPALPKTGAAG